MLFYLTRSLLVSNDDPEYEKIYDAVRNITYSAVQGKHMVLAEYDTILSFESWYIHDTTIRNYYHRLKENYSTSKIPSFVSYYIEVVKELSPEGGDENKGQMLYTDFLNTDSIGQCSLIAENDYDCQFYRYILSQYIKNTIPSDNIRTCISNVNGAGGSTPSAIIKELEKKHVSVCIVDTDICYPGDKPKKDSTCKKCRRVYKNVPFYHYQELDVHEIENLIPMNYIVKIDDWNGEAKEKRKAFDYICSNPYIMRYFDIKKGVSRSDVIGDDLYEFGRLCYESNEDFISTCSYEDKYASKEQIIYPGLIENALKKTLQYLDENPNEEPCLMDFQIDNWNIIGKLLLNFCIAYNSEVVI